MTETENTDGSDLETRVERLERLAGVEGVLPTTRRQYLTGLGGLAAGAIVGRSAVDTATADTHWAGVLGEADDRIAGIYVQEDFGPAMSVDAIGGGVAASPVNALSGNSYFEPSNSVDPTQNNGDIVAYASENILYDEGTGEADWEQGYSEEIGSQSKNADHLYLEATGDQSLAEQTWVTTPTYDMSNYSRVEIEWENTGEDGSTNDSYLVVSDDQSGDHSTAVLASMDRTGTFGRTTEMLNVENVSTSAYIRVHVTGLQGQEIGELLTYKVRLL